MTTEARATGLDALNFIPGATPPMVVGGEGNHLVLADGRRVLDAAGGAIVTNIGHGRPEVAEVAATSTSSVDYVIPPWATPARVALRDRLVTSWLPAGLERVGFVSGGSESTDSAIRLACAHHVTSGRPERTVVIGRVPSYHGVTLAGLGVGGHLGRRAGYDGMLADWPKVAWDDPDALEAAIVAAGPERVAAFIAEPVIGAAGGVLIPPDDYFPRVAEICRRHGVLLIIDEVMTGFGRTGRNFGIEHWGVTPDIMVGGKGLSGGYAAMGGVYATDAVTAPIAEAAHGFMFFTFGAQSSACAISDRVLEIMEQEHLVDRSAKLGASLARLLHDRFDDHPHVAEVRCIGLFAGIELVERREPHTWYPKSVGFAQRVVQESLAEGVWVYPAGSGPLAQDAVMIGPGFTITEDELDEIVTKVGRAVDRAAASV
jgi:adenosylmethionine-8-amino-7-oxononanoate aminotransferase